MTLEELYRAYRAAILPGTEQMHLDFIRERIIAANGVLSYFLLNHLGMGVEDTHCICIMFIFRIGNETGVQTISLSKVESNPQNILSPEKNRKIIEWLQTGELRRGFPDLDIEIGSICESCGELEYWAGGVAVESIPLKFCETMLLKVFINMSLR